MLALIGVDGMDRMVIIDQRSSKSPVPIKYTNKNIDQVKFVLKDDLKEWFSFYQVMVFWHSEIFLEFIWPFPS